MKKFFWGVVFGLVLLAAGAGFYLWSGAFDATASTPPGKLEQTLARFALNRSIARRAPSAKAPAATPEGLRQGLSHYRENCLGCHGAAGVEAAEYGQGLNPAAPDLSLPRIQRRSDGELYWIVAHGIRMTGMPAFAGTHKEDELWQIVAFLRHLPELSPEEEKQLKSAVEAEEGHHHEPAAEVPASPDTAEAAQPAHTHPPGTKPHKD